MKANKLTFNAIFAAIICILAPFSFYMGAVPISLATFAVYLAAAILKPVSSVTCIIIYILLGAVGLPVFSGFIGGFQQLAGLTGGYIVGYIPCAFIISSIISRYENKKSAYPLAMLAGTAVCYLCGTAWYIYQSKSGIAAAVTVCILPFLLGDAVKIAAACALSFAVKPRLKKFI